MISSILHETHCMLGESPLWHAERNSLLWVDIEGKIIYEYYPEQDHIQYWLFDKRVSLLVPCKENNTLLLGMQGGLAKFNLLNNKLTWLVDIEGNFSKHRCNDGSCDITGGLWIGTMCTELTPHAGSLYFIAEDLSLQKRLSGITIPNGIAWSLNNKRMYFVDTMKRCVQSFLFDTVNKNISFEKMVIRIPESLGLPDGMTIDEEGMLWIAHYDGFGVYRWNPVTGQLLEKVDVPVPKVTSCVFGGKDLDKLFITTAKENMNEEELRKFPDSGNVFAVNTNVRGIPPNKCNF